jgi:hypothetical protein
MFQGMAVAGWNVPSSVHSLPSTAVVKAAAVRLCIQQFAQPQEPSACIRLGWIARAHQSRCYSMQVLVPNTSLVICNDHRCTSRALKRKHLNKRVLPLVIRPFSFILYCTYKTFNFLFFYFLFYQSTALGTQSCCRVVVERMQLCM